jgi:serine/threonine-protein kinase RsbW
MRTVGSNNSPNGRSRKGAGAKSAAALSAKKGSPLKFDIRSDFAEGREVQKRIMNDVERSGFDDHSSFAIKLALEEALINAIKHGNNLDPSKKVHIEAKVTPKRFEIVIEDEGKGFDRSEVPDPTADDNLCKCSGRGILLIEAFMNRVQWTRGGRRVKMIKNNEAK